MRSYVYIIHVGIMSMKHNVNLIMDYTVSYRLFSTDNQHASVKEPHRMNGTYKQT